LKRLQLLLEFDGVAHLALPVHYRDYWLERYLAEGLGRHGAEPIKLVRT
jgi:hypothetical protein